MALISCYECNKEVSSSAVTCPHCGVAINQANGIGAEEKEPFSFGFKLLLLIAALVLFYIGGWYVAWGMQIQGQGFALRVNDLYYGFVFYSRFFDSPALSYVFCALGFGATSLALKGYFD